MKINHDYKTYIFLRNAKWRTNFENSSFYVHTHDDWGLHVKDIVFNRFQEAREDGCCSSAILSGISALLHIFGKCIKQVVNDISSEDFDSFCLSKFISFVCNLHIECQDCCEFFHDLVFILG